jgi:hypothetical protein
MARDPCLCSLFCPLPRCPIARGSIHPPARGETPAYSVAYGADAMVTTGSVFEDYTAADECHRRSMPCIRHQVGPMLASPPVAFADTVIVYKAG